MAIEINIDENKIRNLSDGAKDKLKDEIYKYVDNVVKEANLIEETMREDGATTEISSSILLQAVRKNKNYSPNKKKSKILIMWKVMSTISVMMTGLLIDSNGYKDNFVKLIFFIIFLIMACCSTVMQFVKE